MPSRLSAAVAAAEILFLNGRSPTDSVHLYVNSPGGAIAAGLAILDAMDHVSCDVHTYCIGKASSLAAVLVAHGTEGNRYALPHARLALGPVGSGKAVPDRSRYLEESRKALLAILARDTGRDPSDGASEMQAEREFTAMEAIDYGLVDAIAKTRKSGGSQVRPARRLRIGYRSSHPHEWRRRWPPARIVCGGLGWHKP